MGDVTITNIIEELRGCAAVPVMLDASPSASTNAISVSRVKMNSMLKSYGTVYSLVNKCWSNLPDPPATERTFVFMWAIAIEGYGMNHSTVKWEGSTPNTFVHMWSIVDRIKSELGRAGLGWVLESRNCEDYCKSTGMSGPLDAHMYSHELVVPTEILSLDEDAVPLVYDNKIEDFSSFYDFVMTARVNEGPTVISASDIAAANDMITTQTRSCTSS